MALHPHLLKSICLYLMPRLFPEAFVLYSKYKSLSISFSPPPLSSPGWVAPCPFSPPPRWTCKLLLNTGCRVISPSEMLALFLLLFPAFFFFPLPGTKGETFNSYWFGDIQLLLEIPFNHKSWFIVGPLTIPLNCCLANQVHSFSSRTNLL